jgi:hypothetical protein
LPKEAARFFCRVDGREIFDCPKKVPEISRPSQICLGRTAAELKIFSALRSNSPNRPSDGKFHHSPALLYFTTSATQLSLKKFPAPQLAGANACDALTVLL